MIFTLEVLQANEGDCLILHFGEKDSPSIIVIDGGPAGIYKSVLRPRLLAIKAALSPNSALPLSMVMVSHMDDDHVNGILGLTDEAVTRKNNGDSALFDMGNLWFNAFDDIVGNSQIPGIAGTASANAADINANPHIAGLEHHISAVVASTGQGRRLRDNANFLGAMVNNPFEPLKKGKANLVRGDDKNSVIDWDDLKITVVHPNVKRLTELQNQWDKDLKVMAKKPGSKIIFASLGDEDKSAFNLSSIVCLVEFDEKRILLTGDARSDDIIDGLMANKLLDKDGRIHVDILKMPHHGSERNLSHEFFDHVSADHYVISANGKHSNPDKSTLDKFVEITKKGKGPTLHITNDDGELDLKKKLTAFRKKIKTDGSKLKVNFRKKTTNSIVLNLLDKIDF